VVRHDSPIYFFLFIPKNRRLLEHGNPCELTFPCSAITKLLLISTSKVVRRRMLHSARMAIVFFQERLILNGFEYDVLFQHEGY